MLLFSPLRIAGLDLKNRIVRSASAERAASADGLITADYFDIYNDLSQGGAGLLITGHAFVDVTGMNNPFMTGIHDNGVVPGLKKVTDRVHANDTKILLQISHSGRQTNYTIDGQPPTAPSVIPAPGSLVPRELTLDEIGALVDKFAQAALRAREAGFDGVQLHGAHGYLISQFVSPYTNRRTDDYGGNDENRFKFVREILLAIRKACPGFPLFIKWNSEDFVEGGLTQDESLRMVFDMEALGLSGIEVSGGIFESSGKICRSHIKRPEDEGCFAGFARRLKKEGLRIPVILVGGFRTASRMEEHLQDASADLISLCRPLVRDPAFPSKLVQDPSLRSDCVSCNACLLTREGATRCHRPN